MAFVLIYSCSAEEEDTTPPPTVQQPTPEPEPEVTQFTLTVTAGEGGTVSTEGGTYDEGTEVTITATPEEGYEFVGWEGNDSDSSSLSITLNGNTTIQALFAQLPVLILPSSPSKMFTKGVADTLLIPINIPEGFKSITVLAEDGSISIESQPEEGDNQGNIIIRYTNQVVNNVDWDRTIAGYDNIDFIIEDLENNSVEIEYKLRTQPEPLFLDANRNFSQF